MSKQPFIDFAPTVRAQSPLRQAITDAYRRDEGESLKPLIEAAILSEADRAAIRNSARTLVTALRDRPRNNVIEGLVREYFAPRPLEFFAGDKLLPHRSPAANGRRAYIQVMRRWSIPKCGNSER